MVDHPAPFRLEALQAGEHDAEAAAHVDGCEACRAYVDGLEASRAVFLAREAPADVVRRLRAAEPERHVPWMRWLAGVVAVGAVAAVVWVVLPKAALEVSDPGGADSGHDSVRVKGAAVRIAAIVEHADGHQSRESGTVQVTAGDRLRFEVSLAVPMTVTVALLDDSGSLSTLVAAAPLAAGQHLPERTLRVDAKPTHVWVVAGTPEAVAAAVAARRFDGVAALRIVSRD